MGQSNFARFAAVALVVGGLIGGTLTPASGQILIVGNDEKQGWDENGKAILREPGNDTLSVIDISKPDAPQITATIPLMNSIAGPPTNLAISPSGEIALVANSLEPVTQGWGHRLEPDNKVFLIDLKANPPKRDRHDHGRKAALGNGDQPEGRFGARRQSRRRHDLGPVDPRQGRPRRRYGDRSERRRPGFRGRDHPRRQARARGQIRRQQGRVAVDRRRRRSPTTNATCRPGFSPTTSP